MKSVLILLSFLILTQLGSPAQAVTFERTPGVTIFTNTSGGNVQGFSYTQNWSFKVDSQQLLLGDIFSIEAEVGWQRAGDVTIDEWFIDGLFFEVEYLGNKSRMSFSPSLSDALEAGMIFKFSILDPNPSPGIVSFDFSTFGQDGSLLEKVSLSETLVPIPLPPAGLLLAGGISLLLLWRRKKKNLV